MSRYTFIRNNVEPVFVIVAGTTIATTFLYVCVLFFS